MGSTIADVFPSLFLKFPSLVVLRKNLSFFTFFNFSVEKTSVFWIFKPEVKLQKTEVSEIRKKGLHHRRQHLSQMFEVQTEIYNTDYSTELWEMYCCVGSNPYYIFGLNFEHLRKMLPPMVDPTGHTLGKSASRGPVYHSLTIRIDEMHRGDETTPPNRYWSFAKMGFCQIILENNGTKWDFLVKCGCFWQFFTSKSVKMRFSC